MSWRCDAASEAVYKSPIHTAEDLFYIVSVGFLIATAHAVTRLLNSAPRDMMAELQRLKYYVPVFA